MKNDILLLLVTSLLFTACRKNPEVIIPNLTWDLFENPNAQPLGSTTRSAMEGVYAVNEGSDVFGNQVVLKWSYAVENNDTIYRLSVFTGRDAAYFLLEGKRLGDSILLNGNWRKLTSTQTGAAQLRISYAKGGRQLFSTSPIILKDSIVVNGVFGNQQTEPGNSLTFTYQRPLNSNAGFEVLAHRSGGRTSDLLPFSENSIGIIRFASRLGATGIEIDTRLTSDGQLILYHDNTLNLRLIQKNGLLGPIENYTFNQLSTYVSLLDGQRIPSLREALHTVVYETPLRFVWLDTKFEGSLEGVRQLQQEFQQKAAAIGRQLQIVIGLPTEATFNHFKELPNYTSVPSLCELSIEETREINARVWAPRFTLGLQNDEVSQMQAEGRKAFVWTLDEPQYVEQFIKEGKFDGILSNYPSLVAYHHYAK
ncbi:MAG: glycerophosphodiester phosphodiesterase [Flavisolibacter sp.]